MEDTLDFDLERRITQFSPVNRLRLWSSIYVIRLLLNHKEICNRVMDDPESLLRLLGAEAPWPETMIKQIQKEGEEDANSDLVEINVPNFLRKIKTRGAWNRYGNAVSSLYTDDPALVLSSLESHLASLLTKEQAWPAVNANALGDLLGLSSTERMLINYAECRTYPGFRSVLNSLHGYSLNEAYECVAISIDTPVSEVRAALRVNAALRTYRLIKLDTSPHDLEDFLCLNSNGLTFLTEQFNTPEEMLDLIVESSPASTLNTEDFSHLENELSLLTRFMEMANASKTQGCNILLYGPPGTGKTEFARLLAKQANLVPFEILSKNCEGESIAKQDRITYFAFAQRFLAEHGHALLVFDEIEDVFPSDHFGFAAFFGNRRSRKGASQSKAWINDVLESSSLPSIWITNDVEAIDEAYLRRFAYHVEFRQPPRQVRFRIAERCLSGMPVNKPLLDCLADDETLSPAQLTQAAKFIEVCALDDSTSIEDAFIKVLKASQTAAGRSLKDVSPTLGRHACEFKYLNLDCEFPIEKIEKSLLARQMGTLCFYGVPGSGKSSLARHLADAVSQPLLVKRASDLLGKYVGESERAIASMFKEAEQTGSVLLLDEADSFLRTREGARMSWEVTLVNELLQQMEIFNGIFVCTTNLLETVDQAALRRFTFKVRFDSLSSTQRANLFADRCLAGLANDITPEHSSRLGRLNNLTPGDFATICRQEDIFGERFSADEFLSKLERECALKANGNTRAIGFV